MLCPSCVVVIVCVQLSQPQVCSLKVHIWYRYKYVPLVCMHNKYEVTVTYIFKVPAILVFIFECVLLVLLANGEIGSSVHQSIELICILRLSTLGGKFIDMLDLHRSRICSCFCGTVLFFI